MRSRSSIKCFLTLLFLALAGCSPDQGADSLAARTPYGGAAISDCRRCHDAALAPELDPILTNGTGTAGKHDRHVAYLGMPCERCHSGYYWSGTHMNGRFDTGDPAVVVVGFDATNAAGAWTGDTGPGTGGCSSLNCHGSDSPGWYAAWTFPACSTCHSNPIGPRRAVTGAAGDFASNPSITSHHVAGGLDPANGQCLACHNLTTHATGTVLLRQADTDAVIAYGGPSAAEPFCLGCHDADGAVVTSGTVSGGTPTAPFNDGAVMGLPPNRASSEIADQWSRTYGHRQQGLTCIGNGMPGTGCHGNGHGSAYPGLLARNLTLPSRKSSWYATVDEPDYDLCFTCHASSGRVAKEAVLGMRMGGNYQLDLGMLPPYATAGIQTLFRDVNLGGATGKAYDDWAFFSSAHENLHLYHVQIGPGAWNYRDSVSSSIVCLSCHSVHGSNTRWGWVHDSLQFDHFAGTGGDQYGMMLAPAANLGQYPTSCAFNCHAVFESILGAPTHNWFEPSDE